MQVYVSTNHRLDAAKRLGGDYTQPDRKCISWSDSSDRKWLMNHLHWAMMNGRQVTITGPSVDSN